jgi:pilus assembly protein Flp/PilA
MQRTLKLIGRSWWVTNSQLNRSVIMEKFVLATRRFMRDEEGVTAIEYGLIASLIAVLIIGGVTVVGDRLCLTFNTIATALGGTPDACPS